MQVMKVLITGGTGFLGTQLARQLVEKNFLVTLFDTQPLEVKDLQDKVKVIQGDVRDKRDLEKAIIHQDFVVHAAAALPIQRDKKTIFDVNLLGTRNVLEASLASGVKRFVFISTTAVYGVPKTLPETEDSPLSPIGFYGQSKLEAEKLCFKYYKRGLSVNILRPKTFLGKERLGVFSLWFEAIYNNKTVFLLGSGNNRYQLLDVEDLCEAILLSLKTRKDGEIFNLGAEEFGTWRQDLGFVIKKTHSKSRIVGLPVLPSQIILAAFEKLNLSPIAAWHYKTLPVHSYVSIEKAKKMLGWSPKKANKEILLESYLWYKKNRNKIINKTGKTHKVNWNFKILSLINRFV